MPYAHIFNEDMEALIDRMNAAGRDTWEWDMVVPYAHVLKKNGQIVKKTDTLRELYPVAQELLEGMKENAA